jgi:hypothetical protein
MDFVGLNRGLPLRTIKIVSRISPQGLKQRGSSSPYPPVSAVVTR